MRHKMRYIRHIKQFVIGLGRVKRLREKRNMVNG